VVLHDARLVEALVVVDATGPWPAVVHRADVIDGAKPTATAAARTAYRLVARCGEPPGPPGRCLLMDWSPAGGPGRDGPDDEPSYFSAFDLADGWWLVQEVRLAARPPMGQVRLEARLHQRLAGLGVEVHEVRTLEEAAVPLGLPMPSGRQRAVAFGAAAAMVDPLTGWSGGAILRAAPELASAIVAALERRATPAGVSAAAWGAVWPDERRRARALDQHAMRALLRLDRRHLEAFFHALFELPDEQWFGYLTGQASSRQVAATMREAFGGVSSGLRAKLALASPWLLAGGLR
jgi:lycopene beta-cyclase